jgi:putative secretion ATPase (PEP-CTERM system associated)
MFAEFYGLTGKPFQLTPDPAFYFRSVTHRKALSYLGYGLAQGEGFMVITGEVGAGKSTLVAHLMGSVDPAQLSVAQVVTSKLDEKEIVHVVAQSFGLEIPGHDKASALGAIEGFLHDEARAGRRCLLIVDESQNLSVSALEELRMLSNFQLGNHPLLQTLLLGQPEFRSTLQGHDALEQLRQRVIAAHHLEAMEVGEVEPYIAHRLKLVGWNGNPQFEEAVFAQLHEASGGIPRRINQITNRLLLLGAVEQCNLIDTTMLQAVVTEMESERTFVEIPAQEVTCPKPLTEPSAAMGEPEQLDRSEFETLLAVRDAQIVELQDAVIELATHLKSATEASSTPEVTALRDQVARMEARLLEQEQAVRQTLGMLIEWMETEMDQARAA